MQLYLKDAKKIFPELTFVFSVRKKKQCLNVIQLPQDGDEVFFFQNLINVKTLNTVKY